MRGAVSAGGLQALHDLGMRYVSHSLQQNLAIIWHWTTPHDEAGEGLELRLSCALLGIVWMLSMAAVLER